MEQTTKTAEQVLQEHYGEMYLREYPERAKHMKDVMEAYANQYRNPVAADTDDLQTAAARYQDELLQEGNAGKCAIEDHFKAGAAWAQRRAAQHPDRIHAIEGLEYALSWSKELRPTTPGMGRFMTVIQFAINYLNKK